MTDDQFNDNFCDDSNQYASSGPDRNNYEPGSQPPLDSSKRIVAGILGILLGWLGIHKFILGYTLEGIIMLLITLLSCGIFSVVSWGIGIVEGIVYLTKSDEEFYATYVEGRRGWF